MYLFSILHNINGLKIARKKIRLSLKYCVFLCFSFDIAIKSLKKKVLNFTEEPNLAISNPADNNEDSNDIPLLPRSDCDVDLLIDEAKTMFSLGAYNENIVNLQGISYEADPKHETLTQVGTY